MIVMGVGRVPAVVVLCTSLLAPPRAARADDVTPIAAASSDGWTWRQWAGIGAIVVGTGLVVYSSASFVSYNSTADSLRVKIDETCKPGAPCSAQDQAAKQQAQRDYDANEASASKSEPLWIAAAIGGAGFLVGGIFLLVSTQTADAHATRLRPLLGPGLAGLGVGGSF